MPLLINSLLLVWLDFLYWFVAKYNRHRLYGKHVNKLYIHLEEFLTTKYIHTINNNYTQIVSCTFRSQIYNTYIVNDII